jgi:hypothetical protein
MIGHIKRAAEALMFTPVTSEAKCARLPFFKTFLLYRLTNFASLPTFSLDFLSDGETFFYMDGSHTAIRTLINRGELNLTEETILPFLHFYFCYVRSPEGEIILLKNAAEAPQIDLYDEERREAIDIIPEGSRIEADSKFGPFRVYAPALYDSSPMEILVSISPEGDVVVAPKRMLTLEIIDKSSHIQKEGTTS